MTNKEYKVISTALKTLEENIINSIDKLSSAVRLNVEPCDKCGGTGEIVKANGSDDYDKEVCECHEI